MNWDALFRRAEAYEVTEEEIGECLERVRDE